MSHWTYSRLSDYEKCPALYEGRYLNRWPGYVRPPAPALDRGNKMHELMETAVLKKKPLTGALARYNAFIIGLRQEWPSITTEEELALDRHWRPTTWRSFDMWWRGKMDVECLNLKKQRGKVVDWKSGGIYGSNADQVRLYAGVMFERHPSIVECEVELVYLDQRQGIAEQIARSDWPEKKEEFTKRATGMLTAKSFPTKPGNHCDYCDFGPRKGGPCPGKGDRSGLQTDSTRARIVTAQAAPLRRGHARQDFAAPEPAANPSRIQKRRTTK